MNRLDEVCGSDWSVAYEPWGEDRIICRLTIAGVTRSSTGETTNESERSEIGGTVAEAQAFKRASAMQPTLPMWFQGLSPERRRRRVFVEYVMLAGVNDRYEQAVALAELLGTDAFKVNLIPYNPIGAGPSGTTSWVAIVVAPGDRWRHAQEVPGSTSVTSHTSLAMRGCLLIAGHSGWCRWR